MYVAAYVISSLPQRCRTYGPPIYNCYYCRIIFATTNKLFCYNCQFIFVTTNESFLLLSDFIYDYQTRLDYEQKGDSTFAYPALTPTYKHVP